MLYLVVYATCFVLTYILLSYCSITSEPGLFVSREFLDFGTVRSGGKNYEF